MIARSSARIQILSVILISLVILFEALELPMVAIVLLVLAAECLRYLLYLAFTTFIDRNKDARNSIWRKASHFTIMLITTTLTLTAYTKLTNQLEHLDLNYITQYQIYDQPLDSSNKHHKWSSDVIVRSSAIRSDSMTSLPSVEISAQNQSTPIDIKSSSPDLGPLKLPSILKSRENDLQELKKRCGWSIDWHTEPDFNESPIAAFRAINLESTCGLNVFSPIYDYYIRGFMEHGRIDLADEANEYLFSVLKVYSTAKYRTIKAWTWFESNNPERCLNELSLPYSNYAGSYCDQYTLYSACFYSTRQARYRMLHYDRLIQHLSRVHLERTATSGELEGRDMASNFQDVCPHHAHDLKRLLRAEQYSQLLNVMDLLDSHK